MQIPYVNFDPDLFIDLLVGRTGRLCQVCSNINTMY